MTRGHRLAASLLAAIFLIPLFATPSWACSCAALPKEELADQAKVVFTGRAVSIERSETTHRVRFRVGKVYKGNVGRHVDVVTASDSAACGCFFKEGSRYTVFGDRRREPVGTDLCSGTNPGRIDPDSWGLPPGRRS
jgi:hypothetical protein